LDLVGLVVEGEEENEDFFVMDKEITMQVEVKDLSP